MIEQICLPDLCTGCSACLNRCPKSCISMKADEGLGHLHPVIDHSQCIDCGACKKVCPVNNPIEFRKPLVAYAGWDKDEGEYTTSTSGGAASAFARYIISQGGVVYGCAVMPNIDIRHIRIDKLCDISKLKGSKYVQSTISDTFQRIKNDLRQGLKVLFIGTPCQVAGLRSFLGKNDDQLYTVDLICHGVPSLSFLQRHILKITKGKVPDEIYFRKDLYLLLLLLGGKEIYRKELFRDRYEDTYYNAFFDGFSYRDSCHTCKYAQPLRCSDITIGDFWGLKDDLPTEHPNGCSVLLPLTAKGEELVAGIKNEFHLFRRTVDEAVEGNDQLRHPKSENARIRMFKKLYSIIGIHYAYRLCVYDKILKMFVKKTILRRK